MKSQKILKNIDIFFIFNNLCDIIPVFVFLKNEHIRERLIYRGQRMNENIVIKNAKVHNLKNVSLTIPKNKLVVITGLSGSGKSSLAFDTIYAEGQR